MKTIHASPFTTIASQTDIERLRAEQQAWRMVGIRERSAVAKRFASLIAEHSKELHEKITSPQRRDYRETLSAELIPLADASKWLARNAAKILGTRHVGSRERPVWLGRIASQVTREPVGVVLILGTWNYPIFLTGVQILQAIVAGNAVVIKPAVGCEAITARIADLLIESGVPSKLIAVLDSSIESATQLIDTGIDKVLMTGSSQSGRAVLHRLAEKLTPAILELSGCDAVFVLDSADLDRVVAALIFGLRLNGGATCLAPRRVYVSLQRFGELQWKLRHRMLEVPPTILAPKTIERLQSEIEASGARLLDPILETGATFQESIGNRKSAKEWIASGLPVILTDVSPQNSLASADIFAPILMLFSFESIEQAVAMDQGCRYGLTASIFGEAGEAKKLALQLEVGSIVINDMIATTADPRLPFGGVGESGFGVTRGPEGLLELTRPKVVSIRQGRWLPHLEIPQERDGQVLDGILQWLHGATWLKRWRGMLKLILAIRNTPSTKEKEQGSE